MKHITKVTKTIFIDKELKLILVKDKERIDRIGGKIMCRINNFLHPVPKLSNNPSAPIFPNPIEPIPYPLPPPLPPQF